MAPVSTRLDAGVAYPQGILPTPALGAALMSLGTVIAAINAKRSAGRGRQAGS